MKDPVIDMHAVSSFNVDHTKLLPGLYLSRLDKTGSEYITTFDIRITRPNKEPVMDTAAIHAFEHLGATFLRSREGFCDKVIYFGPMGCRTGFYLVAAGALQVADVIPALSEMIDFIISFDGEIPAADARSCGNYQDMNGEMAKYFAVKYKKEVLSAICEENTRYPQIT